MKLTNIVVGILLSTHLYADRQLISALPFFTDQTACILNVSNPSNVPQPVSIEITTTAFLNLSSSMGLTCAANQRSCTASATLAQDQSLSTQSTTNRSTSSWQSGAGGQIKIDITEDSGFLVGHITCREATTPSYGFSSLLNNGKPF